MPVIYKNGQVYGSDEWRSDINTFRSQIGDVIGITKSYTIGPSDWVDGVYTINDPLITVGTNESTQIIGYPSEDYSDELYYMLANASIRIISITNGQIKLKAMGILPTNPLPIIITYRVGASPVTLTIDSVPTSGSNNVISSDGVYHALLPVMIEANKGEGLTVDTTDWKSISCTLTFANGVALLSFNAQATKAFSSGAHTICSFDQNIINQLYPGYYVFVVTDNSGARKGDVNISEDSATIKYYQSNTAADHWVGGFAVIPMKLS